MSESSPKCHWCLDPISKAPTSLEKVHHKCVDCGKYACLVCAATAEIRTFGLAIVQCHSCYWRKARAIFFCAPGRYIPDCDPNMSKKPTLNLQTLKILFEPKNPDAERWHVDHVVAGAPILFHIAIFSRLKHSMHSAVNVKYLLGKDVKPIYKRQRISFWCPDLVNYERKYVRKRAAALRTALKRKKVSRLVIREILKKFVHDLINA